MNKFHIFSFASLIFAVLCSCQRDCNEDVFLEVKDVRLVHNARQMPIPFDSLIFSIETITNELFVNASDSIMHISTASMFGGCRIRPLLIGKTFLKRVSLKFNKTYNDSFNNIVNGITSSTGEDLTLDLVLDDLNDVRVNFSRVFRLSLPPDQTDTFQFYLEVIDDSDNVFRDTSENIIVKP